MEQNNKVAFAGGMVLVVAIAIMASLVLTPSQQNGDIFLINGDNEVPTACEGNLGLVLAQNLTDLCDVTIISPATNELLQYNGSQWINIDSMAFNDTTTCTNLGTGTIICPSFSEDNINIRTLLEGTGIDISNSTTEITITNTLPESTNCVSIGSFGGDIIVNSTNGDCFFRKVLGAGFPTANCIEVTNTTEFIDVDGFNCTNIGENLGSVGEGIYVQNCCIGDSFTTLEFKKLLAGAGISLSSNGTRITITNSGVTSVTSNNNATIGVVPTSGNVVLYPKYELLCQNTLSISSTSISCSSFSARKHLIVEVIIRNQANVSNTGFNGWTFNSDTGGNYYWRSSVNGGADITGTVDTACRISISAQSVNSNRHFSMTIDNILSTDRKLSHGFSSIDSISGSIPSRAEYSCLWNNTSAQITTITFNWSNTLGTPMFLANTNISVWGYD